MDKVNILLVDDQPAKLLSYEVILEELGENLIKANSPHEALGILLKTDIAVVLIDVVMPQIDGFQLAAMIREHPRFQKLAMIFVSGVQIADTDHLRGYEIGAVDYVAVPVVPEVLRAKVRVFIDLYRKTRQLEALNAELEQRVAARTAELEAQTEKLRQSEERRSIALSAGDMGSWEVDLTTGHIEWDDGPYRIFDVDPATFQPTVERIEAMMHPDDRDEELGDRRSSRPASRASRSSSASSGPNGEVRWCYGAGIISQRRRRQAGAHERRHRRRHRAQARRGAPAPARPRGRPSRQEHAGRGAVGAAPHQGQDHRRLHLDRRGPHPRAGRDAQPPVGDALAGRQPAPDRRRGDWRPTAPSIASAWWPTGPPRCCCRRRRRPWRSPCTSSPPTPPSTARLSTDTGKLKLTWSIGPEALELIWVETGGPPAAPPSSLGFGLSIVRSSIEAQFRGGVVYDWRPEGLRCRLVIPRAQIVNPEPVPQTPRPRPSPPPTAARAASPASAC